MTAKLTVVVPTCNRRPFLERCLEALARQTALADGPGVFEVAVVDDGSRDDTLSWLEARKAGFPVPLIVLHQENRGPATARNTAIAATAAPLLLIINDDTILAEDAVARHLAAHAEAEAAGEKRIVLGPFRVPKERRADPFTAMVDATTHMFPFCRLTTRELVDFPYFITCNTSLPRAAFDEAGLFDESFPKPAGEDIEMGYRLYGKGWRIRYDPDLLSWHDTLFTPASYARARFIRGEEDLRFLHKHPEQIGIYQRFALRFVRSHQDELEGNYEGYGAYTASLVAATERWVDEYRNAGCPAERYRAHQRILSGIEGLANLCYAQGAASTPFFAEVMKGVPPQSVI